MTLLCLHSVIKLSVILMSLLLLWRVMQKHLNWHAAAVALWGMHQRSVQAFDCHRFGIQMQRHAIEPDGWREILQHGHRHEGLLHAFRQRLHIQITFQFHGGGQVPVAPVDIHAGIAELAQGLRLDAPRLAIIMQQRFS